VNRLGIRVRADDAELAFARLEPLLAHGAEEVELDDLVEFAVYGDCLPTDEAVRALAGDVVLDLVRSAVDSDWASAWQSHLTPVTVGGFTIRPPWIGNCGATCSASPRGRSASPERCWAFWWD